MTPFLQSQVQDPSKVTLARSSSKSNKSQEKAANQVPIPLPELEKSELELELEPEDRNPKKRKRGRRPKRLLTREIVSAYGHLHNLDWLRESELTRLPAVRDKLNHTQTMPKAQALRGLLIKAPDQVMADIRGVPDKDRVHLFLNRFIAGKKVFELSTAQFLRIAATENL